MHPVRCSRTRSNAPNSYAMIDGTRAALAADMRTIETIQIHHLANVTGGCHKQPPQQPPPQAAPAPVSRPSVDVTVATGAAGGQAIQQALQSS